MFVTFFLTPISHINSLQQSIETKLTIEKDLGNVEKERSDTDSICTQNEDHQIHNAMETGSLISFDKVETPAPIEIVRQPSPPPVLAEVQDLIPAMSTQVPEVECARDTSLSDGFVHPEASMQLHIVSFPTFVCWFILYAFYFPVLSGIAGKSWKEPAVKIASLICYLLDYVNMNRYIIFC